MEPDDNALLRSATEVFVQPRIDVVGLPAGSIRIDPDAPPSIVTAMAYGPERFEEIHLQDVRDIGDLAARLESWPVAWINIDGLGDGPILHQIAQQFGIHPLAHEDVVNTHQRAKVDEFGSAVFVVTRMPILQHHSPSEAESSPAANPRLLARPAGHPDGPPKDILTEQVAFYLVGKTLLTFQEEVGTDCFDPVRQRIRHDLGQLRRSGPDYLLYSLLDAVVDGYFPILDQCGLSIDHLERRVLTRPRPNVVVDAHAIRRNLLSLSRILWPMQEAIKHLATNTGSAITSETRVYFRDCHDHIIRITDLIHSYRELTSDLMQFYYLTVSQKMNEIMKLLTIMATIFMPLSFIASVYGMNFDPQASPYNMPELHWRFGYFYSLTLMGITAMGLLAYVWRKGWLRSADEGSMIRSAVGRFETPRPTANPTVQDERSHQSGN